MLFLKRNKTSRIEEERRTVEVMIRLYCRHKEGNEELCPSCERLLRYADAHVNACPFKENKRTCRLCKVHCYGKKEREQIRQVMRYAGPRMLFYHPIMAIRHLIREHF